MRTLPALAPALSLAIFTVSLTAPPAWAEGAASSGAGEEALQRRRPVNHTASPALGEGQPAAAAPEQAEEVELVRPQRRRPAPAVQGAGAQVVGSEDGTPVTTSVGSTEASSEAFGTRRIQLFLVPVGTSAVQSAGPVQAAVEKEIRRLPGFNPVDLGEALSVPPSAAHQEKLGFARHALADGHALLQKHEYMEAVNRYSRAIRFLEEAGDALEAPVYAEAWVRLGLALTLSGEEAKAKECFRMAARADQAGVVAADAIDARAGALLEKAREEVFQGPSGALSVVTQFAGARVFLGGVYKGLTPLTLDRVPAGFNYVRVDRPGFFPEVRLVRVQEAFDTPLRVSLRSTPQAQELQHTMQQLPRELDRTRGVPDMVTGLGRSFHLERAVVATVRMENVSQAAVRLLLFDLGRGARLADETARFSADSDSGLEAEVARWARQVLDRGDGTRDRSAWDPLDRSDGTEGWYSTSERQGSRKSKREQAKEEEEDVPEWERRGTYESESYRKDGVRSRDPLDHNDGTEGW